MNFPRYLCSQLVDLRNRSVEPAGHQVVNLEEIWRDGAVLESEEPVEVEASVEIRCEKVRFAGRVVNVEQHEFGWRLEVEFSPMTLWNPEEFQPAHLLNL